MWDSRDWSPWGICQGPAKLLGGEGSTVLSRNLSLAWWVDVCPIHRTLIQENNSWRGTGIQCVSKGCMKEVSHQRSFLTGGFEEREDSACGDEFGFPGQREEHERDTGKRKGRVEQGHWVVQLEWGCHKATFSEGALLQKGLIHDEGLLTGPQVSWVRDLLPIPQRPHTPKKGTVQWKRSTALGLISTSATQYQYDLRHSLSCLNLRPPSVKRE